MVGSSWEAFGALLTCLGALLGHFWPLLGHSWGLLGRFWGALGHILGRLGGILEKYRKNVECDMFFGGHVGLQNGCKINKIRIQKAMHVLICFFVDFLICFIDFGAQILMFFGSLKLDERKPRFCEISDFPLGKIDIFRGLEASQSSKN